MVNELKCQYCGLCISQSADEADHGLKVSRGQEGTGPDCMTELRVTEVNVLQVRACHTFEHLEVLNHEIFCN